ncbi:MAG: response regulator transcription factor [Chloroflexota bacterium]
MDNSKVLLVDDEPAITSNLAPVLQRSGFIVETAADGIEGLEKTESFRPDIIILDVDMPRLDGRSVLRKLRQQDNWVPIILLTKHGESIERTLALEEGADDYLNKPFETHELMARIKAILRRTNRGQKSLAAAQKLVCGPLILERLARRITLDGAELQLTPKAVSLLEYFLLHPDELMTRDRLLDAIWGWTYPTGTRTVDTRIAEIRQALGDDPAAPKYIETVPSQGYRFVGQVEAMG